MWRADVERPDKVEDEMKDKVNYIALRPDKAMGCNEREASRP
jgi:hypothetical protein